MKNITYLIIALFFIQFSVLAQTNDSPISAYEWKGKKTVLKTGYVVLKSDKRLDGKISLIGEVSKVTHVYFEGDGKELEFPVAALKSFGVVSESGETVKMKKVAIPPSTKDLFKWRTVNEAEGKVVETTKPRSGYVILLDGNRIDGEIQLKKKNGVFVQIKLKTAEEKFKFEPKNVQDYGLALTIAELTKNGEKVYKDEAKNFQKGKVVLNDGKELPGLVAFTQKYQSTIGTTYGDVMYAANQEAIIKTFQDADVKYVTQEINGNEVKYTLFEGGFVSSDEMADAEFADPFQMLNQGKVVLKDGNTLVGEVSRTSNWELNFKDNEGVFKRIGSADVEKVIVNVNNEEKVLINVDDQLIEELFNGNTFQVYINPNPTHVNKFATKMAKGTMSVGTTVTGAAVSRQADKSAGVDSNVDSLIMNSSTEKLEGIQNDLYKAYNVTDHEGFQDSKAPDQLKSYEASIAIAVAGRKASREIVVYYRETIIVNKKTQEKHILYKHKSADDTIDGLLMGCYTFLSMDKTEQKLYYDLKNITSTAKMLDECY